MEALHDVVKAGKALHIGASSMWAWQFAQAQSVAPIRFVSMQNHYNLVYREEEREMLPLCTDQGVGVIPWSPLARGLLTRPTDETTARRETDEFGKTLYGNADHGVIDAVAAIADERGVSRAQIALAWVSKHPAVSAPIVGATKQQHLDDAIASLSIELTADEIHRLEQPYTAQPISGHA